MVKAVAAGSLGVISQAVKQRKSAERLLSKRTAVIIEA
jgi:hypothetical protein